MAATLTGPPPLGSPSNQGDKPMIRTILVPASGEITDAATFAAALAVARKFGAHLDVLHVRADPIGAGVALATGAGSGAIAAGLIDQLEADAQQREARARDNFEQFCRSAGLAVPGTPPAAADQAAAGAGALSAEWHVETGSEPEWVAAYGRTADLIVASRSPEPEIARPMLEAVLIDSGRPLLIAPESAMPTAIERVAIAWKDGPQAARAVALAMPFLAGAKQVLIRAVEERADERDGIDRLARNLAWHGLAADIERLQPGPDGAAATLLAAVAGRADLLVMGGYGHSRVREWVFGGFTQHVLVGAPLPVLMVH
jgi:nucleotide-binding universal stress UspA family protein